MGKVDVCVLCYLISVLCVIRWRERYIIHSKKMTLSVYTSDIYPAKINSINNDTTAHDNVDMFKY